MRVQGGGLPGEVGMTRALEARMGPGPEGLTELFKLLAGSESEIRLFEIISGARGAAGP
jgi:hypothetical protein